MFAVHCEGQAKAILDVLRYDGAWLELSPMKLIWFRDLDLSISAKDKIRRRQMIAQKTSCANDPGEAVLYALLAEHSSSLLTSGDKRAMRIIARKPQLAASS